ncbi:hypothetical protein [Streptomyces sp. BF23-19]|uniref:hypothetical protein n=1 Tax=Streptomyces sp. BF23-19 TaxID=3240283 RepID=UPI0034E57BD4
MKGIHMGSTGNLVLDDAAVERFDALLADEGIMRAGFVISEADNTNSPEDASNI